jgi:hypothetical protein
LARSGLFERAAVRPLLRMIQAVPIYRPQDAGSDAGQNRGSFDRCYELLANREALLVFPEGVSHSKPFLQPLKTGVARIALGSALRGGPLPAIVPAGMTFLEKGRFRSRVLIQIGAPLHLDDIGARLFSEAALSTRSERGDAAGAASLATPEPPAELVRALTERIAEAIRALTLNVGRWEDLVLLRQLERFFHFRRGRHPSQQTLRRRFRTVRKLLETYQRLHDEVPEELNRLRRRLLWFERVRRLYGVEDYHLRRPRRERPALLWLARASLLAVLVLPFALFGFVTSGPPYLLVSWAAPRASERYDQYDTHKIVLGIVVYALVWGAEVTAAVWRLGPWLALGFALALPVGGAAALGFRALAGRILEATRIFVLFRRRPLLREELLSRRREIEDELAALARRARSRSPLSEVASHAAGGQPTPPA